MNHGAFSITVIARLSFCAGHTCPLVPFEGPWFGQLLLGDEVGSPTRLGPLIHAAFAPNFQIDKATRTL